MRKNPEHLLQSLDQAVPPAVTVLRIVRKYGRKWLAHADHEHLKAHIRYTLGLGNAGHKVATLLNDGTGRGVVVRPARSNGFHALA